MTFAGVVNIAQLLCGVIGILIYIGMMAVTIRFFPIRVLTKAGTIEVDFKPGLYHDMQIVQGIMSTISALLFLGRDSFCVSDKVVVNSRPAHQWCFDWMVGISISIVLAAVTVVVCVIGLVGAVEEMVRQLGSLCLPSLVEELRCAGTLTDDALIAEQFMARLADGAPTCVEQSFKIYIPACYVGIYSVSCFIGVLSVLQGRKFITSLDGGAGN